MILRLLFWFILLLPTGSILGQNVTITGKATDYAGKKLLFYTYREPISHEATTLAETVVEKDGSFQLSFTLNQTAEIYAELEKYRGTLVVVPGKSYQITLPPYAPRTAREAASPYFQPELYWIAIQNIGPQELNILVRSFLTDYNKELATHVHELYQSRSHDTVKAILKRLDKNYPTGKDLYFNNLKEYSFGELELTIAQNKTGPIEEKYFSKSVPALSHPSYQHLFNAIFTNYLTVQAQDLKQKKLLAAALEGDFNEYMQYLKSKGFQRETAELIAVKSYYDGYFSGKLNKQLIINGLKNAEILVTFTDLKKSLPGILAKLNALQEGKTLPGLPLKDLAGHQTTLLTGNKFLYLVFFKSNSRESRQELDSLVLIHKKLSSVLDVLPVSLDTDLEAAGKLWKEQKYPWQLTFPLNQEKCMADFRIKNVPEFYLIAPDQKILLAPALPPTHNFEALFLKIFRETRFRQTTRQ